MFLSNVGGQMAIFVKPAAYPFPLLVNGSIGVPMPRILTTVAKRAKIVVVLRAPSLLQTEVRMNAIVSPKLLKGTSCHPLPSGGVKGDAEAL